MQPTCLTAVNVPSLAAVPFIGSFTISHAGVAVRIILPPTRMLQFLRGCERKVDRHQCVVTAEPGFFPSGSTLAVLSASLASHAECSGPSESLNVFVHSLFNNQHCYMIQRWTRFLLTV